MTRLRIGGSLIGCLSALMVFPFQTFATPLSLAGPTGMRPAVSLAVPVDDGRFPCCGAPNDGLSLTASETRLAEPGGASAAPYLFRFPEAPASGHKAELRDPAPKGMIPFFFVVIVLGGLIRYLTSPAYYRFIAEILDPKIY
jgi:hypothetical protein